MNKSIICFLVFFTLVLGVKAGSSQNDADNIIFNNIMEKSKTECWKNYEIGNIIGKIAYELIDTPYESASLENPDGDEVCTVIFTGLDCVTFYETALGLARIIQKGELSYENLVNEVTFTRYRDGILDGYTSRLHYTSEWILNNVKKNVIKDITKELGGDKVRFNLDFMSTHPQYYPMLEDNEEEINKIAKYEAIISRKYFYVIPHNKIKSIEKYLETGDIIALTSNVKGLDYAHTGLIYKKDGKALFLNASSNSKKVILDDELHKYVDRVGKKQSITVLRPLNAK